MSEEREMEDRSNVQNFNQEAARFTAEQAAYSQQRLESWYKLRGEFAAREGWALKWDGFALVETESDPKETSGF
jgi:hypothetical protein